MTGTVLVTGSSAGIGEAVARHLLRDGWSVIGVSRAFGAGRELSDCHRDRFRWVPCDLSDPSARSTIAEAIRPVADLSGVVCAAGSGVFGSVEDTVDADSVAQFETNYHGVVRTIRAALPTFLDAGGGRIVVIGSLAGRAPIPFQAHYSASKAALAALLLSLAGELRGSGIRITLVEPGDIRTAFNDAMRWTEPSPIYRASSRAVEAVVRRSLDEARPADDVARVVVKALTASNPRFRYTVGKSRWMVATGSRLLPDRIAIRLIRQHFDVAGLRIS